MIEEHERYRPLHHNNSPELTAEAALMKFRETTILKSPPATRPSTASSSFAEKEVQTDLTSHE